MAERQQKYNYIPDVAKPVHIQRLEKSLDLEPFLSYVEQQLNEPISNSSTSSSDEFDPPSNAGDDFSISNVEVDKSKLYNFLNVSRDRKWLQDLLLEDSDSSDSSSELTDSDIQEMLKQHLRMKKYRQKYYVDKDNVQYQYYGAGILSNYDKFPEHQKSLVGTRKRKREKEKSNEKKILKKIVNKPKELDDIQDDSYFNYGLDWDDDLPQFREEFEDEFEIQRNGVQSAPGKKKQIQRNPEVMAARRKKVWILMCKKEVGKVQRAKVNNHKEALAACKKTAQLCMRVCRQKAMQSQKQMKETLWRAKRLTREMQSYWKRYDRVERETRRRMEKEAEEQRKMDVEIIEAKRQQRKLNFLITQTELYAHFMSRKLGKASPEEQLLILNQLDEEKNPRLASIDDYDSEAMKAKAKKNAQDAFTSERARTKQFDLQAKSALINDDDFDLSTTTASPEEHPQPILFQGNLKGYQLRGMNWLANLYDQGISGILADEMGLGKTVQSIAFLCHIAEKYSVWGPFLIISPASTLHNWQQEMERFVPSFKVVPYWGNPNERKILRQFWDQKDMHTKEASFHVVITSYQIVITDFKYFNRIKWQYMILDEAQAIKSTSSVRWKMLLGFSCRNRLLLSGTPIQNSMAELWALLHFIMPTLFDSHDEFNEWFSKDIESHAENKTGIDEKHLSRLHMILKPFMLRRIKKDVENELSDKIEIMVYCPLTTRQKLLYMALKKKIRIEDLLHYTTTGGSESGAHSIDRNFTSNLMNLVMQFRKVCNHPELFERRDAKSPFYVDCPVFTIPKLIYEDSLRVHSFVNKRYAVYNKMFIFDKHHLRESLQDSCVLTLFSFVRLLNLSYSDLYNIFTGDLIYRWQHYMQTEALTNILYLQHTWGSQTKYPLLIFPYFNLSSAQIQNSDVFNDLTFTALSEHCSITYSHTKHTYHSMPETIEHRLIRSRMGLSRQACTALMESNGNAIEQNKLSGEGNVVVPLIEEFPYKERAPHSHECQRTAMPKFLFSILPKVQCKTKMIYCNSRTAQWDLLKYCQVHSWQGLKSIWVASSNIDNYNEKTSSYVKFSPENGLNALSPLKSWSNIIVPDKETLVTDAGKLSVLDSLLKRLKEGGHRVLIYSQMTKMIDLLEEYMWHRKHKYMRLDGSSKISERRDMVADFQARTDIFVFLLSTRAGGLGINLTAADTVIFYDSDWNPTVDQQAMDRAHRLGQTKQVTVYRLICKGSIEERILQRAREKSEIQRMVISGGNFKPDTLKPKEVVSLLLDDEEIEMKYRQRTEERRHAEEQREREKERERERKRKQIMAQKPKVIEYKKIKSSQDSESGVEDVWLNVDSCPQSPCNSDSDASGAVSNQEDTSNEALVVDLDFTAGSSPLTFTPPYGSSNRPRAVGRGQSKRGRPRGSRRSMGRPMATIFNTNQSTDSALESSPSTSSLWESSQSQGNNSSQSPRGGSPVPIRRGPGRPRLKPGGPSNQGIRGITRPRKSARPLPVPLRSGSATAATAGSILPDSMNFCFYESNPDQD